MSSFVTAHSDPDDEEDAENDMVAPFDHRDAPAGPSNSGVVPRDPQSNPLPLPLSVLSLFVLNCVLCPFLLSRRVLTSTSFLSFSLIQPSRRLPATSSPLSLCYKKQLIRSVGPSFFIIISRYPVASNAPLDLDLEFLKLCLATFNNQTMRSPVSPTYARLFSQGLRLCQARRRQEREDQGHRSL